MEAPERADPRDKWAFGRLLHRKQRRLVELDVAEEVVDEDKVIFDDAFRDMVLPPRFDHVRLLQMQLATSVEFPDLAGFFRLVRVFCPRDNAWPLVFEGLSAKGGVADAFAWMKLRVERAGCYHA